MAYSVKEWMQLSKAIYEQQEEGKTLINEDGTFPNTEWKVLKVCDDEGEKGSGMYACLVDTGDGNCAIVFRGTQPKDWGFLQDVVFSDGGLLNSGQTAQQRMVEKFVKEIAEEYPGRFKEITFVGHSLGGNLAEHAAITAPPEIKEICHAVSLDGPGYSEEYLLEHADEIAELAGKMDRYQWSFVGALLNPPKGENYHHLILQGVHDPRNDLDISDPLYSVKMVISWFMWEGQKHLEMDKVINGEYTESSFMPETDVLLISSMLDKLVKLYSEKDPRGITIKLLLSAIEKVMVKSSEKPIPKNTGNRKADFSIKPQSVNDAAIDLERIIKEMNQINEELIDVRQEMMPFRIFSRLNLLKISFQMQKRIEYCEKLKSSANEIAEKYEWYEKLCVDYANADKSK